MCNGGRETLQREEQQSEPGLVLPELDPCHHRPAQAGTSVLSQDTMGRQHLTSEGQPGVVSRDPQLLCVTLQGIASQHVWYKHMNT